MKFRTGFVARLRQSGRRRHQTAPVVLATFWFVTISATNGWASKPYIPTHDDDILETLPSPLLSSGLSELRRKLREAPENVELATAVAGRYLEVGNTEGDPRFYGYARAALRPWWELARPPAMVLRLRAELKEKEHLYDEALVDLTQLLEQEPRDAQAWLEVANIYRTQGRYAEAWRASDRLGEFAGQIPTSLARLPLQAATGHAEDAYDSILKILPAAQTRWPSTVPWLITLQAIISQSLGRSQQAEEHFREGLALNPGDSYLLRAFGDFLLDQGRPAEALSLLREHVRDNGILLTATIAARRSGTEPLAAEWQAQLKNRFEELRLRGGDPHGRFEARFYLELENDPARALTIAVANWQVQKEIRDSRNVLEAALAAHDFEAARPVLEFLAEHGTQDVILEKLARELDRK